MRACARGALESVLVAEEVDRQRRFFSALRRTIRRARGLKKPASARSKLVLPAPLAPRTSTNAPGTASKLRPLEQRASAPRDAQAIQRSAERSFRIPRYADLQVAAPRLSGAHHNAAALLGRVGRPAKAGENIACAHGGLGFGFERRAAACGQADKVAYPESEESAPARRGHGRSASAEAPAR